MWNRRLINFKPLTSIAVPGQAASSQSPRSSQQELLYTAILTVLCLPSTGWHTHTQTHYTHTHRRVSASHFHPSSFVFAVRLSAGSECVINRATRYQEAAVKTSALSTGGKSHTRCSASVGGSSAGAAQRGLEPTPTRSLP